MELTFHNIIVLAEIAGGLLLALAITWLSVSDKMGAAAATADGGSEGPRKYHPFHVAIHWFVVFVMAQLLTRGALIMVNTPNSSPEKIDALRAHSLAGILLLVLMLVRLTLLKVTQQPQPVHGPTPLLDRIKRLVHPALYVSIFVQVFAGLGIAYQADLLRLFVLHQGRLPESFWIYSLRTVHYINSRLLMALIAIHIAGALFHTLIMRDGLLRRMSFGGRLRGGGQVGKFAAPSANLSE